MDYAVFSFLDQLANLYEDLQSYSDLQFQPLFQKILNSYSIERLLNPNKPDYSIEKTSEPVEFNRRAKQLRGEWPNWNIKEPQLVWGMRDKKFVVSSYKPDTRLIARAEFIEGYLPLLPEDRRILCGEESREKPLDPNLD